MKTETLEKTYLEETNAHNRVEYVVKQAQAPFANRDFCTREVWKHHIKMRDEQEQSILVWCSEDHPSRPSNVSSEVVRGKSDNVFKLSLIGKNEAELVLYTQLDTGTPFPSFITRLLTAQQLQKATHGQQYFQQLRALKDYDANDGIAIGEAFMLRPFKSKTESSNREKKYSESKYEVSKNQKVAKVISVSESVAD